MKKSVSPKKKEVASVLPKKRGPGRPRKNSSPTDPNARFTTEEQVSRRSVEPAPIPMETEVVLTPSVRTLSKALGLSRATVTRYLRKGMGKVAKTIDGYDVNKCKEWVELVGSPKKSGVDIEDEETLKHLKLKSQVRKLHQEARGRKLRNDEYEGLLLPADDVRQWIASRFLRIRTRLEQLPAELQMVAPANQRAQLHADLSNNIHALLIEMSTWETQAETGRDLSGTV